MSASARLVVQMTPREKEALARKARRAGLSAAEFVRRRLRDDTLGEAGQREEIEALLAAIETAAPAILKSLANTIAMTEAMTAQLTQKDGQAAA